MGRRPRDTKRGSEVHKRQRRRIASLRLALQLKLDRPALPITVIAHDHELGYAYVRERWKKYEGALTRGDPGAMDEAVAERRGGHNRIFTVAEEAVLGNQIREAHPSMTHVQVKATALKYRRQLDAEQGVRMLRSHRPYKCSNGHRTDMLKRQHLSSHKTKVRRRPKRPAPPRNIPEESLDFSLLVRDAIMRLGPDRVFNMDETPVEQVECPSTGFVTTGSKEPAFVDTTALHMDYLTTFPTISAAGSKLQQCAIIRGKTDRCLNKIRIGANAVVNRVRLYHTERGKMNTVTMMAWLQDVILPYTHGEPCALILDAYASHWAATFVDLAELHHVELICVPHGETPRLQPFDVSFNGPMAKIRTRLWRQMKEEDPDREDTWQAAVERAQLAYEEMSVETTLGSFRNASLID